MLADTSAQLLTLAARTRHLPTLPPYPTAQIRQITREVRDLDRANTALLAPYTTNPSQPPQDATQDSSGPRGFDPASDPATATHLLINHLTLRRNKRVLMAYHRQRTERLEGMCWRGEDAVSGAPSSSSSSRARGEDDGGALSPEEEEYVRLYGEVLAAVKGQWTDVDLTGSLEPPGELFVDVRCVRDAGVVETEYGSIALTKNSQYYVRQNDVERLIAQGYLQRLDG